MSNSSQFRNHEVPSGSRLPGSMNQDKLCHLAALRGCDSKARGRSIRIGKCGEPNAECGWVAQPDRWISVGFHISANGVHCELFRESKIGHAYRCGYPASATPRV